MHPSLQYHHPKSSSRSWTEEKDVLRFPRLSPLFFMFDPMADLTGGSTQPDPTGVPAPQGTRPPRDDNGGFGKEIHSISIRAKQRTFYIDLKESSNGKFFKISEKSRGGRKTTIMFDCEDLPAFINALNEMQTKL